MKLSVCVLFLFFFSSLHAQSFPQGKFYELYSYECSHEYNFSDSSFSYYEECDMGPLYGQGIFKYVKKGKLLILNYKDYISKQKQSTLSANYFYTNDSSSQINVLIKCLNSKEDWLIARCRIYIGTDYIVKQFSEGLLSFSLKNKNIDSIKIDLIAHCPIIYKPNFNNDNNLNLEIYLQECENAHYIENQVDTLFIKKYNSDNIKLRYSKSDKNYYNYVRIEQLNNIRKKSKVKNE